MIDKELKRYMNICNQMHIFIHVCIHVCTGNKTHQQKARHISKSMLINLGCSVGQINVNPFKFPGPMHVTTTEPIHRNWKVSSASALQNESGSLQNEFESVCTAHQNVDWTLVINPGSVNPHCMWTGFWFTPMQTHLQNKIMLTFSWIENSRGLLTTHSTTSTFTVVLESTWLTEIVFTSSKYSHGRNVMKCKCKVDKTWYEF